ncbi:MAG: S41 family peptidase, partial [Flavobacteriales bacterium]|nr:S41 family peptidase [Flavobacteriales bacterium]
SEIVSGAVQDWDRGLIIGRRSFGKGLVQKPYPLPDGSMVRLTIQRYYTPTGRCIQKPYDEYKNDYFDRLERGEFFSADSIDLPDSLIYYTPNDREVYGGGGIIPDIFIPVDTSMNSKYFTDLRRKGLFNTFTLQFLDEQRDNITGQYKDMEFFKDQFEIDEALLDEFVGFAEDKGVEKNEEGLNRSKKMIKNLLKAMIARGIWKSDGYFYVVNDLNPMMVKAIEAIEGNAFEEMRLSYR